ncbi:hypothetical protein [Lactiplantibacillus modestisalitolerans]|uniref:Uncharacterized protein n=1 Tax=Lactiplantibacillus modestisalitolerans TaxID=1457219 RepID=A0ABV5WS63_9LACO
MMIGKRGIGRTKIVVGAGIHWAEHVELAEKRWGDLKSVVRIFMQINGGCDFYDSLFLQPFAH